MIRGRKIDLLPRPSAGSYSASRGYFHCSNAVSIIGSGTNPVNPNNSPCLCRKRPKPIKYASKAPVKTGPKYFGNLPGLVRIRLLMKTSPYDLFLKVPSFNIVWIT